MQISARSVSTPLKSRRAARLHRLWIERRRPQRHIGAVAQRHGHLAGRAIDFDMTEELHARRGRQVLLVEARRLDELHFGAKGVVEFVRTEGPGMQRTGDEFPERVELL